jgi:hypothetical protein
MLDAGGWPIQLGGLKREMFRPAMSTIQINAMAPLGGTLPLMINYSLRVIRSVLF